MTMGKMRGWLHGRQQHKYAAVGEQDAEDAFNLAAIEHQRRRRRYRRGVMLAAIGILATLAVAGPSSLPRPFGKPTCDTVEHGYQCDPRLSHSWGQYSPYFSVPTNISAAIPLTCEVTFVNVLSRHGARDPTSSKTKSYNATIQKIHAHVKSYPGKYAFLANYTYNLGADQLTTFGQQEMINSGIKFYDRYESLARSNTPFVRASGEARVIESAQNFTQGFHIARTSDFFSFKPDASYPYPIEIISEAAGSNNTLNHGLCTAFEDGRDSSIASAAQSAWASIFIPPIQARLNTDLPGANLTLSDTISMMDLCPFTTVASSNGTISPFCDLFTLHEFHQYSYYETLGKYYGYSYGNPLGPTQGVGYTNELIARLTSQPVKDHTSTNHTLDSNPATFPLGLPLYADFSHDNDMTAIFSALGLYNGTVLSTSNITKADMANGYSAAWTVPFAARAYFEKLRCWGYEEELVRVIINDRVLPLTQCGGDTLGRCSLSAFVDSLGFAQSGGLWDQCFV